MTTPRRRRGRENTLSVQLEPPPENPELPDPDLFIKPEQEAPEPRVLRVVAPPEELAALGLGAPEKNPHAVALGRRGGQKGGPARAKALSPEQRREIAKKAAVTRW